MATEKDQLSAAAIEELVQQRIANAIAVYEANRNNGNGVAHERNEGSGTVARTCSYKDFLNCKPNNFKGTEGAVGLIQWFEKMESVFSVSNCEEVSKVKYATCTLQNGALTWWNTYAKSVGIDIAHQLPWEELKKKMVEKYCPRNELQKLEVEFWNLTVKGNDIEGYTNRFQELALLCPSMVEPEFKRIERYIWGLPSHIQDGVTSSKPKDIQDAISMAHSLMAQSVRREATLDKNVVRNPDAKRKWEENSNKNYNPQQARRTESSRNPVANSEVKKGYNGNKPYCNQCNRHHTGPCDNICGRCKKPGHRANDCRSPAPVTNSGAPGTCFECGEKGHFRNGCPKLKNQNNNARGRVYVINAGEASRNTNI